MESLVRDHPDWCMANLSKALWPTWLYRVWPSLVALLTSGRS